MNWKLKPKVYSCFTRPMLVNYELSKDTENSVNTKCRFRDESTESITILYQVKNIYQFGPILHWKISRF